MGKVLSQGTRMWNMNALHLNCSQVMTKIKVFSTDNAAAGAMTIILQTFMFRRTKIIYELIN